MKIKHLYITLYAFMDNFFNDPVFTFWKILKRFEKIAGIENHENTHLRLQKWITFNHNLKTFH